jgi:plasmid stabilization system protein ParE
MKIKWLPGAISDLQRFRNFILPNNKKAAERAVDTIKKHVQLLNVHPQIGKPADIPEFRDLIITFGSSSYILRYRIEGNAIIIVALKHAKEAGFKDHH